MFPSCPETVQILQKSNIVIVKLSLQKKQMRNERKNFSRTSKAPRKEMKLSASTKARCPWRSRRKFSLRGLNKLSCFTRLPQDTNCRQCDSFCDIFSIMNVWWKIITWRKYLFAFGCMVNESGASESENSRGKQISFPVLVFDTQTKVFFSVHPKLKRPQNQRKAFVDHTKSPFRISFPSLSRSLSFSFSWFQDGFEYLRNKRKHWDWKATWRSVSDNNKTR